MKDEYGLLAEWRYKDGKSRICKVTNQKRQSVGSLWEEFFTPSFYFTEKTRSGKEKLEIASEIKMSFTKEKSICKLVPLSLIYAILMH